MQWLRHIERQIRSVSHYGREGYADISRPGCISPLSVQKLNEPLINGKLPQPFFMSWSLDACD